MLNENQKQMLKYFSTLLKKRSKPDEDEPMQVDSAVGYYLSRKDIVEIVMKIYEGKIPGNPDLALMEKEELMNLIKDDLFIISFMLDKICVDILVKDTEN